MAKANMFALVSLCVTARLLQLAVDEVGSIC